LIPRPGMLTPLPNPHRTSQPQRWKYESNIPK
jgi:hypothetical protein